MRAADDAPRCTGFQNGCSAKQCLRKSDPLEKKALDQNVACRPPFMAVKMLQTVAFLPTDCRLKWVLDSLHFNDVIICVHVPDPSPLGC